MTFSCSLPVQIVGEVPDEPPVAPGLRTGQQRAGAGASQGIIRRLSGTVLNPDDGPRLGLTPVDQPLFRPVEEQSDGTPNRVRRNPKHRPLNGEPIDEGKTLDFFTMMPGTDVLDIDDGTVPEAVRQQIEAPATDFMRGQVQVLSKMQTLVVIPVDFGAFPRNNSVTQVGIRDYIFGRLGTASINAFFAASSYNRQVLVEGGISDWVRLPDSPAAGELSGSADLICAALEGATVDWAPLADGDGVITQDRARLIVIAPFGSTGAARYHRINFTSRGRQYTLDGYVAFFDCKRPNDFANGDDALSYNHGTACHEMAHVLLGLPDRYGTSPDHGGRDYVGAYDLMSNHGVAKMLNPHDRIKAGWLNPKIHHLGRVPRRLYKLRPAEEFGSALVVYSDLSPEEYWIFENRHLNSDPWGVDRGFPSSGLAVWWVDMTNDNVVLLSQHCAADKPLHHPQPEPGKTAAEKPLFDSATGTGEAVLFPQRGTGFILVKMISPAGPVMSFEI